MKITNMNRNQLVSYAAQMRDRSRGLDRIMGELKGERAENRRLNEKMRSAADIQADTNVKSRGFEMENLRLTALAADANENAHVWQTERDKLCSQIAELESEIKKRADEYTNYHDAVGAEIADLKSKLAARPEAAEKVDGVFEVGDRVVVRDSVYSAFNEIAGTVDTINEHGIVEFSEANGSRRYFKPVDLRHAAPSQSPCQSFAAKDAEIAELKKQLAAKPEAAEKVDGVFEKGDSVVIVSKAGGYWTAEMDETVGNLGKVLNAKGHDSLYDGQVELDNGWWYDVRSIRHAAPASATCQSCAAKDAEIADLKKQLAAKPEAAEKVEGVFAVGDQVRVVSKMNPRDSIWHDEMDKLIGRIGSVLEVRSSGDIVTDLSDGCGWQYILHAGSLRHASPATSPCQSCAAKDAEIAALNESRTCVANECSALNDVIETLKKAAHADWVKSDRTDVELYNAQLDLEKLQSQIDTQRENSADTQQNLERAREIIGQHEASILRVTAELTAALGGGA